MCDAISRQSRVWNPHALFLKNRNQTRDLRIRAYVLILCRVFHDIGCRFLVEDRGHRHVIANKSRDVSASLWGMVIRAKRVSNCYMQEKKN